MGTMMSQQEAKRAQIMELLTAGNLDQKEAAKRMDVTVRQTRRILKRYRALGVAGLINKQRVGWHRTGGFLTRPPPWRCNWWGNTTATLGQPWPARSCSNSTALPLSVDEHPPADDGRGFMGRHREGAKICVHPMRQRRARLGELIQIDGSPAHAWFEERGASCTLLVFIDAATGTLMQLRFTPTEATLGYMHTLHDHIAAHGVPVALYSERHSIFRINAKDADRCAETQFSRAARELGIECIHAHSPQAKGHVERANQTLQDRLLKEMRLAGISDIASASAWLPGFIADYNRRFAVVPQDSQDAHLPYPGTAREPSAHPRL